MSVLIKGMEMPTCCAECRFFVDTWCYAFKAEDWRNAYNKPPTGKRLDNCPLVPVPPHGRLIDADALLNLLNHCMFPSDMVTTTAVRMATNWIKEAPTIIEAEEGK